jgi:uncharacterized protein (TIGR00730 family)
MLRYFRSIFIFPSIFQIMPNSAPDLNDANSDQIFRKQVDTSEPTIDTQGDPATCPSPYNDFRSGSSWRIFRIMAEFIEGFQFLADFKKEVTILGSARTPEGTQHYEAARKLGYLLGKDGFTIITGGGPGIMEAGNRGAHEAGAESVGINIQLPHEQRINPYVKKGKGFYYFFTRKVILTVSAQAYCVFPGGYGTIDELFELLTLIQTHKMCRIPVVLVGKDFWNNTLAWVKDNLLKDKYIDEKDLELFQIVDTAEEAYEIVKQSVDRPYF